MCKVSSKQTSKQASKKTDFTVDLTWWGLLRFAPIIRKKPFTINEWQIQHYQELGIVTKVIPINNNDGKSLEKLKSSRNCLISY